MIEKVKNNVRWTYIVSDRDLNKEEIVGMFYENELQKTNYKKFRIEKVIKRKLDKLYVKWKEYNNSFNSWIDEKDMSEYFPKPNSFGANVKFELDLSNYATKTDLKNTAEVDTSSFAKKVELANLKF